MSIKEFKGKHPYVFWGGAVVVVLLVVVAVVVAVSAATTVGSKITTFQAAPANEAGAPSGSYHISVGLSKPLDMTKKWVGQKIRVMAAPLPGFWRSVSGTVAAVSASGDSVTLAPVKLKSAPSSAAVKSSDYVRIAKPKSS